ncbi:MAG: cache domain-containing protein, partial [Solirubrobacteraceae bacterium]|nr:cache domain-containing protein [Solirubrobacteraceae bacterium]
MSSVLRDHAAVRLPIWASVFLTLICIAIGGLSGWREWSTRDTELKSTEIELANLARSLVQQADDTFELADNAITDLVHRMEADGNGPAALTRLRTYIDLRKLSLGRIRGLFVYDEAGRWLATTEAVSLNNFNNSDRDYFRHHAQSVDHGMLVGRPIKSRSGGQWIITVSKRFNNSDGKFAGVVLATIDVAYFAQSFGKFNTGKKGSISLLNADGIMLARSPDYETYVGRDLSSTTLFDEKLKRSSSDAYYFKSPLDGVQRLSAYQSSDQYPLVILATRSQDEVLASWRRDAAIRTTFVVVLLMIIAVIGLFFIRQLQSRQRMAAELEAKEADFRLLAEESSDMVTRIGMDERIRYVSPSSSRVVGWSPEQLMGKWAL